MNKEVSFELAKLLKEVGFDQKSTINGYKINGEKSFDYGIDRVNGVAIAAPTIAEVVMWLYEKHGVWISVDAGINGFYGHYKINPIGILSSNLKQGWTNTEENPFNSPTEAYESAIEYVLKLKTK